MSAPETANVRWSLGLYSSSPALSYLDSDPSLPHAFIHIGGLTDLPGSTRYVHSLAKPLSELGFSVVLATLGSSLGGYGTSTLEGDAQEITKLIRHLRGEGKKQQVVLMGHSTGCQDLTAFLSVDREEAQPGAVPSVRVQGAILQAPVSDREDFERRLDDQLREQLKLAKELVSKGQGGALLPPLKGAKLPSAIGSWQPGKNQFLKGNRDAILHPAITAYRFVSFYDKGGEDDFFSSDLPDEEVKKTFEEATKRTPRLLALLGAEDEYLPPNVKSEELAKRWQSLVPSPAFQARVVPGANHKVEDPTARGELVKLVVDFVKEASGHSTGPKTRY